MVLIDVFESRYVFFLNGTLSDLVSSGFFPSRSKKVVFSLELLNLYRNLLLTGFLSIAGFIQTIKKLQPGWKFPAEVESVKTYLISSCFKAHFWNTEPQCRCMNLITRDVLHALGEMKLAITTFLQTEIFDYLDESFLENIISDKQKKANTLKRLILKKLIKILI
jgi:hypothetical protein